MPPKARMAFADDAIDAEANQETTTAIRSACTGTTAPASTLPGLPAASRQRGLSRWEVATPTLRGRFFFAVQCDGKEPSPWLD